METWFNWPVLLLSLSAICLNASSALAGSPVLDLVKTKVWGPGLKADFFVPVRYFFIQAVSPDGENITEPIGDKPFEVTLSSSSSEFLRVYLQTLDRKDGFYIVIYRIFGVYHDVTISIRHGGKNVAKSPYLLEGLVQQDKCDCPEPDVDQWYGAMECPESYTQIDNDLARFGNDLDLEKNAKTMLERFNNPGSYSLAQYKIIDNKIYRKTFGQHVGFKMFSDNILLSLARKVHLPDVEFFVNLGDWPLEDRKSKRKPVPLFSWCGSDIAYDIVMPTYDLTESTLEMLSRVSLDIFSAMGNSPARWGDKSDLAFWRGRDSRQERLDLVMMSRKYPKVIDAKMTRMFFFPHDKDKYGDLVDNISFFDFFKYKYQLNIDGTVAAYRLPYLLAGDSVVLKQDSEYYEHFYKGLEPYVHYIPFKRDLSDLRQKIRWAKDNDEKVQRIVKNAQDFVLNNISPKDVFCYHTKLFQKYSKKLQSPPLSPDDTWDLVEQPDQAHCECHRKTVKREPETTATEESECESTKCEHRHSGESSEQKTKKDEL